MSWSRFEDDSCSFRGPQPEDGSAGSLQLCVHQIKEQKAVFPPQTFLSTRGRRLDIKVPSRKEALRKPVRVPGKTHQKADPPWRAAA